MKFKFNMSESEKLQWKEEYSTKVKFIKTDFEGKMHVPAETNFHPNLFKGTEKEYDSIVEKYLTGKDDEFKIIGYHTFDTYEEYIKEYKNLH